ncbi:MAG: hypothetical protein J0L84_00960 [Verrucomicrobia bacterium]|nr:hypothetical protein [Verrucomicrobiota bacterium]
MNSPESTRLFVQGCGAVSPAGWGAGALKSAVAQGNTLPVTPLENPAGSLLEVRRVPPPPSRPAVLAHPRLRRSSLISQFACAAAREALDAAGFQGSDRSRWGVVCTVMGGSVTYSRRFYAEVLAQPSTASPLLFPETVFNAPASHLAAVFGLTGPCDTLVADQTGFLSGLAVAADWLVRGAVDRCLVVAAEEADWSSAEAHRLFDPQTPTAEGAGALCLSRDPSPVELRFITDPELYTHRRTQAAAAERVRGQCPAEFLEASWLQSPPLAEPPEATLHGSLGALGDGLAAVGAWTCVTAVRRILDGHAARIGVHIHGANLQSMAAGFAASGLSHHGPLLAPI